MDAACSSCSQCRTSKVKAGNQSSSRKKIQSDSSRVGIIRENFDSAWANGFLRRPTLITLNHSKCVTIQYDSALLSIAHAARWSCGQKVSSGRSEKYYTLNGAANFLFFETGHYVCMWGCLLKTLVCCQASPPFPELGEGNVSCLQIHYDRLDTANLSFHVKTCQWHLAGRKSMSDLKCFQKGKNKAADMWMKTLDALKCVSSQHRV